MTARSQRLVCSAAALLLVLLPIAPNASAQVPGEALWADVDDTSMRGAAKRQIVPERYRSLSLNKAALADVLALAPLETRADSGLNEIVLSLPLPEGGFGRFRILEAPIMEPGLAAKFPEIRTYRGQGIDDREATLRFDLTPAGFHAMILSPAGNVYIDPYSRDDSDHYISYLTRDAKRSGQPFQCGVQSHRDLEPRHQAVPNKVVSGSTLRTYRLAVGATGEYTAFHGGTVAQGQAAIVTAMNRVNGIYEREVAIRMILVANNDQVVYTNASTDPYNNNSAGTLISQNQSNLDSVIGSANYDIGHVFSTGGGGLASLRVPCINGSKARGITGQSSPTGDPFWVDYVAHEMGHQWGGNHTFNGNAGNCSGGNRNGSTAYEPGSGTTIMAYAGICSPQNIQSNSDDYFHGISLDEIVAYSANGNGDNCAVRTATGNSPPTVNAGSAYTIPLNTPFELCGSATDPENDPLTYGWEEFDLGATGAPNSPSGNAAIFRTFDPTSSNCRTFPQLSDLVNNTQTLGEILPSYARTMNFRLTARDNRSGGGGVADDSTTVTVSGAGGPFVVTAPNTAVTWPSGTSQTVSWNVAGTDLSPISCTSVDILLSTDGGTSYPTTLAASVANSGSQSITVPGTATPSARVKVQCSGNIFFDISNVDFTISGSTGSPPTVAISAPADGSSSTDGDSVTFTGTASDPEDGDLSSSLSWTSSIDGNIGSGGSFATTALSVGSHTITASVTDSDALSGSDVISITVTTVGGGNGPQTAAYDSGLGAPACAVAGSSCDSVALLDGVADAGPEPNQPNTLDTCTDGTSGSYHSDESNDRIVVSTLDGTDMTVGATVRVDATVWAWTTPTSDTLDLYYAADATNPTWVLIGSLSPSTAGAQTLSTTYTLPNGALQAVRANFRYQGSQSSCSGGNYDDADDLVFPVNTTAPCTVNADCDDGAFCNGTETCNVGTGICEAGTAVSCGDGVSCTVDSCNEATDACDNTPTNSLCDNGLFCDGTETCDAVAGCQAGAPVACGDGVGCTVDSCNEATDSCDNAPDDSACDNGLFCDGTETCDAVSDCQAGSNPCSGAQTCNETTDICEGPGGCLHDVDFESGNGGWTGDTGACSTGDFVVGTPDATAWQLGAGNPGQAFFTALNPNGIGGDDVDGGTCEALSPVVNAGAEAAVLVSLDYYHGQRDAGDDAGDGFTIEVLNNGSVVDTLVAIGDVTNNPAWTPLATVVSNPGNIQLRVRATDATGGGDIVEGGIDNVQICPATPPPPCTVEEDFSGGLGAWVNAAGSTCSTGTFVAAAPTQQTSTVVTQVGGDHTSGSGKRGIHRHQHRGRYRRRRWRQLHPGIAGLQCDGSVGALDLVLPWPARQPVTTRRVISSCWKSPPTAATTMRRWCRSAMCKPLQGGPRRPLRFRPDRMFDCGSRYPMALALATLSKAASTTCRSAPTHSQSPDSALPFVAKGGGLTGLRSDWHRLPAPASEVTGTWPLT